MMAKSYDDHVREAIEEMKHATQEMHQEGDEMDWEVDRMHTEDQVEDPEANAASEADEKQYYYVKLREGQANVDIGKTREQTVKVLDKEEALTGRTSTSKPVKLLGWWALMTACHAEEIEKLPGVGLAEIVEDVWNVEALTMALGCWGHTIHTYGRVREERSWVAVMAAPARSRRERPKEGISTLTGFGHGKSVR